MQSWMALLVAGMLIGPGPGAILASASTPAASSVEAIVDQAYQQWFAGLGARQSCSSGVSIVFEELPSRRGEYRTGTEQVAIDPGDALEGMDGIVVHELSHHTFLACGAFADTDFARAFYAAQGLPAGRDWFDYSLGWTETPAEHFAEAMAASISGGGEGGIPLSPEAVEVVSMWLAGAALVTPAADTYDPVAYSENGVPTAPVAVGGRTANPPVEPEPPPPLPPSPPPPESPTKLVTLEAYAEILELVSNSYRASVFWLNTWRATGPIW